MRRKPCPNKQRRWHKFPLFIFSLFLFVLAIMLMKEGAQALGPLVRDYLAIEHFADALGFGWLLSYLIMSGSPVAAAGLTLFDAGIVDQLYRSPPICSGDHQSGIQIDPPIYLHAVTSQRLKLRYWLGQLMCAAM